MLCHQPITRSPIAHNVKLESSMFHRSFVALALAVGLLQPTAALAQVQLVPVASDLTSPVFATGARDGTLRLFIVEQAGIIRVMPLGGGGGMATFLDIRSRVLSGGERGLLGLAFHPSYTSNRRFFVYYTRSGDGAIVVAEYQASSGNRDAADATERVLLTIPHPNFANHNGGMLAFGPDGYLYIGVGDGGSGNDPPNNAQNKQALLGKLLRIDVNSQAGGLPYAIPPSNPFAGAIDGRDEIFAYGLRNPWRFAFDRATSQLWLADVGQIQREEVNAPIVSGGNYGWRVYEGNLCTNNDRTLCTASNYIFPIFDYSHGGGRCSITGGYVYRGTLGAFATGTYVYGDFCSGEILAWDGNSQRVVLDTGANIASFAEDDAGEIYVVTLSGTVSRITGTAPTGGSCTLDAPPGPVLAARAGATTTIAVAATAGCDWSASSGADWITFPNGASGTGSGALSITVAAAPRTGWPIPRIGLIFVAGRQIVVIQG
jgi:hypothetical protein